MSNQTRKCLMIIASCTCYRYDRGQNYCNDVEYTLNACQPTVMCIYGRTTPNSRYRVFCRILACPPTLERGATPRLCRKVHGRCRATPSKTFVASLQVAHSPHPHGPLAHLHGPLWHGGAPCWGCQLCSPPAGRRKRAASPAG